MFPTGCKVSKQPVILHVAIPYSENVQDIGSNYYVNYLKEKTGLELEITLIRQSRCEDYLDALFASDADVDIVMFGPDFAIDDDTLKKYTDAGDIYTEEGRSCYLSSGVRMPNDAGQVLWINSEWLTALGLSIPQTTEDFYQVLCAFRDGDPNGNGLPDEIPLAGAGSDHVYEPWEFILNAYGYNDPYQAEYERFVSGAQFREGLTFCRKLYEEKLLEQNVFDRKLHQLTELINSPQDLVGAFTTYSISDVIYSGNPEIMAKYMHVAPLLGPSGERHAVRAKDEDAIGAIITQRSRHKQEAKLLLDTMLTEEASLIARYGEPGVDWDYSDGQDVSIFGGVSTIVTRKYIWNTPQNKHLNGIGPMDVPEKYIRGVTWNGMNSDAEYIDARAQMSYQEFLMPQNSGQEYDAGRAAYIDEYVRAFITGRKKIERDEVWKEYLDGLSLY